MKACVIFNPAARGDKAARFRRHLSDLEGQCALKPTAGPGGGQVLAAAAVREGFDTIVAAGGDGTLNEVLNGIGAEAEGFERVRLGVLPLGTMNVFARELGLPRRLEPAWEVIQRGRETRLDVAEAVFESAGAVPQRRYFVQLAGAGLDSKAIELLDLDLKRRIGALAYVVAAIQAMQGPLPLITASDGERSQTGQVILVGNGRYYGGSFPMFPKADLRDGLLEVTIFPRAGWGSVVWAGWGLLTGRLYTAGGARHWRVRTLHLSSEAPVALQVEGENVGPLPARLAVQPGRLRVLVP